MALFTSMLNLLVALAHFASEYPLGLIQAIVHSLRQQLLEDGSLSELDLKVGGPVPSESIYSQFGEEQLQEAIEYYDDVTGKNSFPRTWSMLESKRS